MLRGLMLSLFAVFLSAPSFKSQTVCAGFLPENDMKIEASVFQVGGISLQDFNAVLDEVEQFYTPVISAKGARLEVNRKWDDPTVNASANQMGNTYAINMYGGLARHPSMNKDGFTLVACHEIGHHLGGAPKIESWWGEPDWATNEGGSDYFASLRCLRFMFHEQENLEFVKNNEIDPTLRMHCEQDFDTQAEENLCMRIGMAGFVSANLFQVMHKNPTPLRFDTPDPNVVTRMADGHPAPQCRLDTYFQGALCRHDMTVPLSDNDPNVGACSERMGQKEGLRPRCWFSF